MKTCTKCQEAKPYTSFYRFTRAKDGRQSQCKLCAKAQDDTRYRADPEKKAAHGIKYRRENREKVRAIQARHYIQNTEKVLAWSAKYYADNAKKKMAGQTEYYRKYPEKLRAKDRKRQACTLNQTPRWADLGEIQAIYAYAELIQKQTGINVHVDHIVPLQAELARGLHVAANLQILPAVLNWRKNNTFEVAA